MSANKEIAAIATKATGIETYKEAGSSGQVSPEHGPPDVLDFGAEPTQETKKTWRDRVAYLLTKDFWFILVLGQILAICILSFVMAQPVFARDENHAGRGYSRSGPRRRRSDHRSAWDSFSATDSIAAMQGAPPKKSPHEAGLQMTLHGAN